MKPVVVILLVATAIASTQLVASREAHGQGASAGAPFQIAATGKRFWRLDDAVKAAAGGDAVIRIAPGRFHDCATVTAGRVAFVAEQPGTAIFDGQTCEGKAALVLRGTAAAVSGIIFENMRVNDGNGAGIRLEHGDLQVKNATFRNSESGILTADDPAGSIVVDQSTFSGLGRCDRGLSCAHGIYAGHYGSLTVTHSRFERGTGGHYLKSRATRNTILDNSFDDVHGHATNYMIDLPAGSVGRITGNVFVMGPDKENHSAIVAVAAEARENPSAGLQIAGNRANLAPGIGWGTTFVADWSHEPLAIGANQLGSGIKVSDER